MHPDVSSKQQFHLTLSYLEVRSSVDKSVLLMKAKGRSVRMSTEVAQPVNVLAMQAGRPKFESPALI